MTTFFNRKVAVIVTGLAVAALGIAIYLVSQNGKPAPSQQPANIQGQKPSPDHAQVIEDMAARLEQNPNDGRGWYMLALSYASMGRYTDSVKAFEKAANLIKNDAQFLVDYADVLAVANDRNLFGKPLELVNQALKLEPNNIKALALIGTASFGSRDYSSAVKYWEKVVKLLPPDEPLAKQMKAGIAEARAKLSGKKSETITTNQTQTIRASAHITGVLMISPELASRVSPTDTVFLSAKDISGSPAPIAVMRAEAKDLPMKFTLDDSMSMLQDLKLSNYQEVLISAKISKAGKTTTHPGDMHGEVPSVKVGESDVRVVIDKVYP